MPFLAGLSVNIIAKAERAFFSAGMADVAAISDDYVSAGAIHQRLRSARDEMEQRVKHGGTVTVLGLPAGDPLAWHLLTEPENPPPPAVGRSEVSPAHGRLATELGEKRISRQKTRLFIGILRRLGARQGEQRYNPTYDVNNDGVINFDDLTAILSTPTCHHGHGGA